MRMRTPPITGVPCLVTWPAGPSSRMNWPSSRLRRNSMNFGPMEMETTIATIVATTTRLTSAGSLGRVRCLRARPRARP